MSCYSIVEGLLSGIPGFTAGTNIFSPEHPQVDFSIAPPIIKIARVSSNTEYSEDGLTRVQTLERIQLTISASTAAGLNVLLGQVHAVMAHHYPFSGGGPDGYYPVPESFWTTVDWLIIF